MANTWFQFKHFKINQDKTAMKVGVDSVLLGAIANFSNSEIILDIGAGTGLLSFMAEQKTNAKITAIEIEENAYNQCIENIYLNKKENSIEIVNIAIQDFAKNTSNKFDYIISNPPYFNNSFISENKERNTARQNSKLSYNELIKSVSKLLNNDGKFGLIIPYEGHEHFIQLALKKQLFCIRKVNIFPTEKKKANRIILEFSKIKYNLIVEDITIRNSKTNEYSKQYKDITKEFYLNF